MSRNRGIPTLYNGVQFRSRLEARWAAFFDLCKWSWKYEPFDLPGYIPDFALYRYKADWGRFGCNWIPDKTKFALVEVKPVDALDDTEAQKAVTAINRWVRAGNQAPMAVCQVGNGPFRGHSKWFRQFGWALNSLWCDNFGKEETFEYVHDHWNGMWGYSLHIGGSLNGEVLVDNSVTFNVYHDEEFFSGGKMEVAFMNEDSIELVDDLWNKAGNAVQWKGAQNRG